MIDTNRFQVREDTQDNMWKVVDTHDWDVYCETDDKDDAQAIADRLNESQTLSKRYWVFCFANYEAEGGMSDFVGAFDTVEEARNLAQGRQTDYRTVTIVDVKEEKRISVGESF